MLRTHEQHSRTKLLATILSVLVVAGIVVIADHIKSQNPATTTSSQTTAVTTNPSTSGSDTNASSGAATPTTPASSSTGGYTDGTYSASSSYFVPSGQQSIKVDVTLASGVITGVSIQNSESDPTSAQFQQDFTSQYKSYVVGQKISSLRLSVIAGASDTTQSFSNALDQIANKAKA